MKRMQLKWLLPVAILSIGLALTGCSGGTDAVAGAEPDVVQVVDISPTETSVATATPKPTSTPLPEPTPTPTEITDPVFRYIGPETDSEALAKAETGELGMLSIAWFHADW